MTRIASLCAATMVFAASCAAISFANDGGGSPDPVIGPRNCAGAVRSAQMAVNKAEDAIDKLNGRTATRAEHNAAKAKLAKAKERLARARAGRC